jgi:excisionase family DNA binding protein
VLLHRLAEEARLPQHRAVHSKVGSLHTPIKIDIAAELLGLHPQTLYKWTRQGELPSVKMGGAASWQNGLRSGSWANQRHSKRAESHPQKGMAFDLVFSTVVTLVTLFAYFFDTQRLKSA